MAIWYEVEKTEDGIKNFLESNWNFHDFKIQSFNYDIANNKVDVFLKYDTDDEGVLLRFVRIDSFHVSTDRNWNIDWIPGSSMFIVGKDFIWFDDDSWGDECLKHIDEMKAYATWVKAERVFWAITDSKGNAVEMPEDRINQIWQICDKVVEKHFNLNEFIGDWNSVLSPKWDL